MDIKKNQQDPIWESFLSSRRGFKLKINIIKLGGAFRTSNLSSLILKSNIFQNDSQANQEMQRQTLQQLEIKLGQKDEEESEEENDQVQAQFRKEPLRPKQTNEDRDMYLLAKPLLQEFTEINIVKQPQLQPKGQKIALELHKNLDELIQRSEDLTHEKKNGTIISLQNDQSIEKVVNQRFLDQIRKLDTTISPIKAGQITNPNELNQKKFESSQKKSPKTEKKLKENQIIRSKYDKEFDFKQMNTNVIKVQQINEMEDVQLPQSIQEIMNLKQKNNQEEKNEQIPEIEIYSEEYQNDLIEFGQFENYFTNNQKLIMQNPTQQQSYIPFPTHNNEIDFFNISFQNIMNIVQGNIPLSLLRELVQQHEVFLSNQAIKNKKRKSSLKKIDKLQKELEKTNQSEQDEKEDEEEEIIMTNKCIGTTPRPLIQDPGQDISIQISQNAIEEETRNVPRVKIILEGVKTVKNQYKINPDRIQKAQLKVQLNHKLIDLINLIMLGENANPQSVGDAIQYLLLKSKKELKEQSIDGISKLELLYIFLTEYKEFKLITEKEIQQQYVVVRSQNQFQLIPNQEKLQNIQKKQEGKHTLNKKSENMLKQPRYLQATESYKQSTTKKNQQSILSKSPYKITPNKVGNRMQNQALNDITEGNWITKSFNQLDASDNSGWTKIL